MYTLTLFVKIFIFHCQNINVNKYIKYKTKTGKTCIPESDMMLRAEHIMTKANIKRHKHRRAPIAISRCLLSLVEASDGVRLYL